MPSKLHEAPLVVLREDPSLVLGLVRDAAGIDFGPDVTVALADTDLTQAVPIERRADAVVLVSNRAGRPVGAFVVEVQRRRDDAKRFSWPLYVAAVRSRHRCPCALVVLALNEATARWCRIKIDGFQPPHGFVPLVLGPRDIPRITDLEDALRSPLVAVLSAIVHAQSAQGEQIIFNAMASVQPLAPDTRDYYTDVIVAVVGPDRAKLARLELKMSFHGWEFQSPLYKKRIAEARAEGWVEAKRTSIRTALAARGITLSDTGSARLEACAEVEELERWFSAALVAAKEDDVWGTR